MLKRVLLVAELKNIKTLSYKISTMTSDKISVKCEEYIFIASRSFLKKISSSTKISKFDLSCGYLLDPVSMARYNNM